MQESMEVEQQQSVTREGVKATAELHAIEQYRDLERRDSVSSTATSASDATDGDESSTSTRSESSGNKAEDGRGRGRATVDHGTNRRKRAPEVLRTATAAEQRFFADAYTQETLYPGLFLQGSPPEFVTSHR